MNLAIRGIEGQIAHGDTFHNDRHPDLRADFILANPPFNVSDWGGERLADDKRWRYGVPPRRNANFAWVQHIIHHLAPDGTAGFVLANGSMSSNQSGEGAIRKSLIEADLVDCMVALPGQLFYSTQIPACLWFLARDRHGGTFRDRRGEVLFIDARKLGRMVDRTHRELTDRTSPASPTRTMLGAEKNQPVSTPTFRDSARARRWRRSVGTAMCSHPAVTSEWRHRKMTASRSSRRCGGLSPSWKSSAPREPGSTPPSPRT